MLAYAEIFELAEICLGKYIQVDGQNDQNFLNDMSHYFAKLVYDSAGFDINKEVPL